MIPTKLPPERLQAARERYEADDDLTLTVLAAELEVCRQTLSKFARRHGWAKVSGKVAHRNKKVAQGNKNINENLISPSARKCAIDGLIQLINNESTPPEVVLGACSKLLSL